jgi:DNA-binding beta-propeller fold protein YncE
MYFAFNGDLLSGSTSYAEIDSTGTENGCGIAACFTPTFLQGFSFSGGTQTSYVSSNSTLYYVKTSTPRYIGRYVSGTPASDIDLTVGAVANSIVYDPVTAQLYVSTGGTNVINVISPSTNLVTTSIAGAGANPSVMTINSNSGKIYVYSATNGSIAEIATASNTVTGTKSGFPTGGSFGANPHNLMVENTDDDIIYLAIPDLHRYIIYDIQGASIQSINLPAGPDELSFDMTTHLVFGVQSTTNVLFSTH